MKLLVPEVRQHPTSIALVCQGPSISEYIECMHYPTHSVGSACVDNGTLYAACVTHFNMRVGALANAGHVPHVNTLEPLIRIVRAQRITRGLMK